MAQNRDSQPAKPVRDFGQGRQLEKSARVSLYARVSTPDQQTLPVQLESMRSYAAQRGWTVVLETPEIASGSVHRPKRELKEFGVAFVSLTEALDLATASGRAMTGLLSVFAEFEREILRERILAGIAQAGKRGTRLRRPRTALARQDAARQLFAEGVSKSDIARLAISGASVRRVLGGSC